MTCKILLNIVLLVISDLKFEKKKVGVICIINRDNKFITEDYAKTTTWFQYELSLPCINIDECFI